MCSRVTGVPMTDTDSQDTHQTPDSWVSRAVRRAERHVHVKEVFSDDSYVHGRVRCPEQVCLGLFCSDLGQSLDLETQAAAKRKDRRAGRMRHSEMLHRDLKRSTEMHEKCTQTVHFSKGDKMIVISFYDTEDE